MFDQELTAKDVADLYKGAGISKQRYKISLGPPKPTPELIEKQLRYITTAQVALRRLKRL